MSDAPTFALPTPGTAAAAGFTVEDVSTEPKWRTWVDPGVTLGRAARTPEAMALAVAPNEWIVVGDRPDEAAVDITHVRAMFRLSGERARWVLSHVCALDLSDRMTPNHAAGRTLVAGVATELVRDDGDNTSYLLLMSRSFARDVWNRLIEVAEAN